jgi:hypothetical protein
VTGGESAVGARSMTSVREGLAARALLQAESCRGGGSTLYAQLCQRIAEDLEAGGPTVALLEPARDQAFPLLGLLAGVHRLALMGAAPAVARHFPSTGGDGDVEGAWRGVHALLSDPPEMLREAPLRTPQTNEVGRSASLVGGFLTVAAEHGPRLRVLELGASAGLNLRFDRYRYEQGDVAFGPADAPVRFTGLWPRGVPPFGVPLEVVDRRGCDLAPVDVKRPEGRLTLLSGVWADQLERLRAAIDIAAITEARVERADLVEWLEAAMAEPAAGCTTVVFHSIVWPYLSNDARIQARRALERAGSSRSLEAPLAWLRLEPGTDHAAARGELVLTVWPDGTERVLARCAFHVGPVEWLAANSPRSRR